MVSIGRFLRAVQDQDISLVRQCLSIEGFSEATCRFGIPARQWAEWAMPEAGLEQTPCDSITIIKSHLNVLSHESLNTQNCDNQFGFQLISQQCIPNIHMAQFIVLQYKLLQMCHSKYFVAAIQTRQFLQELITTPKESLSIRKLQSPFGHGVFTTKKIQAGQALTEYLGVVHCAHKTSIKSDTSYSMSYPLPSWFGWRWTIDAKHLGNIARFINHSRQPNAHMTIVHDGELPRLAIEATHAIAIGEQVLLNYGPNYWSSRREHK